MSDRAGYAGDQVEVDDLHRVRAIIRTPIIRPHQSELEAALRDVDEYVFAKHFFGARFRVHCTSRGLDERHARFL